VGKGPDHEAWKQAKHGVKYLRDKLDLGDRGFDTGLILSPGWLRGVPWTKDVQEVAVHKVPGLDHWVDRGEETRKLLAGRVGDRRVVAFPEAVHLNYDMDYPASTRRLVRLQVEVLLQLGVRRMVVTTTCVGLKGLGVGDVAVARSFITLLAAPRPLYGHERVDAVAALDPDLRALALQAGSSWKDRHVREACLAVVTGPDMLTEEDHRLLALAGAQAAATNGLAESAVAALHGAKLLLLGYVGSDEGERLAPAVLEKRAVADEKRLGGLLASVLEGLPAVPA
jgi:hypothetical protein